MNLSILYKKLTNRKYTIWYKYVLSLLIWIIWFISFWYCDNYNLLYTVEFDWQSAKTYYISSDVYCNVDEHNVYSWKGDYICYQLYTKWNIRNAWFDWLWRIQFKDALVPTCIVPSGVCWSSKLSFKVYWSDFAWAVGFLYSMTKSTNDCPTCDPQYTSEQCKSVYWLVSSWQLNNCENNYNNCQTDLNSCQNNTSWFNDLLNNCSNSLNACNNSLTSCLQQNCPETVTGTNRSSLFINNIQYPWAPTIKFTIPEEIERDQNTDEEETNIDVIWYGYDQDKMQQMVNTQYYKPTAEEMSWLMEKVADFLPLVAVALLIARIRRVIKKVF